jgi:hypothetical protein
MKTIRTILLLSLFLVPVAGAGAQERPERRPSLRLSDLERKIDGSRRDLNRLLEQRRYFEEQRRKQTLERQDWDRKMNALRWVEEHNRKVDEKRREEAGWKLFAIGAGLFFGLLGILFGGARKK